jgi:hypothetical protein
MVASAEGLTEAQQKLYNAGRYDLQVVWFCHYWTCIRFDHEFGIWYNPNSRYPESTTPEGAVHAALFIDQKEGYKPVYGSGINER